MSSRADAPSVCKEVVVGSSVQGFKCDLVETLSAHELEPPIFDVQYHVTDIVGIG